MEKSVLFVCTTCRSQTDKSDTMPRPGARLLERLQAEETPPGLEIRGVECLSACNNGCSIALSAPGKWHYVYGLMEPELHAADILDGAAKYAESEEGIVPWRERPQIFRKQVISRIPPMKV